MLLSFRNYTLFFTFVFGCLFLCVGCEDPTTDNKQAPKRTIIHKKVFVKRKKKAPPFDSKAYERMLQKAGFVEIHSIDSAIFVDLRYTTHNNFMKMDMYGDFKKAYLHADAATKLSKAQSLPSKGNPSLHLVVFDAIRPHSIQQLMWDSVDLPLEEKRNFLADPRIYSMHSFGIAVDCGIAMSDGELLDMGTDYDHAGELAYPILEDYFLERNILGQNQVENRKLLRNVMIKAGFIGNDYEWWHFTSAYRKFALAHYPRVETFNSFVSPMTEKPEPDSRIALEFKVQIAASATPLSPQSSVFKGLSVQEYTHEGMYKYTAGSFSSLPEVYHYKDSLAKSGFPTVFVVCFSNGKRVSLQDAKELLQ